MRKKPLSKVKLVKEAARANIGAVPSTKVKNNSKKLRIEQLQIKELNKEIENGKKGEDDEL